MIPTKERAQSSALVSLENQHILIDCGENTQRQLNLANIRPTMIDKIIISHWHGDHVFGLPGIFATLGKMEYKKTLQIYGPKGSKERISNIIKAFDFPRINFKINEFGNSLKFIDEEGFFIEKYELDHNPQSFGFRICQKDKIKIDTKKLKLAGIPEGPILKKLQKGEDIIYKGKKYKAKTLTFVKPGKILGFIADTKLCNNCYKIAKDVDLLISEATMGESEINIAKKYKHLTAKHAAEIAKKSNSKKLVMNHFSQRYKSTKPLLDEAKKVFKNSECAKDFMKVSVK